MKKLIFILFILTSCSTSKKALTEDTSRTDTVTERKTVTRPGDTVRIDIPNIRYKDTVITRYNYDTKTLARVTYDSEGNQKFDCISAEMRELLETIKQTQQNNIKSESERESSFNPQYIIYAIAILAFIVFIGLGILGFMFLKLQKQLPNMTADIVNKLIK